MSWESQLETVGLQGSIIRGMEAPGTHSQAAATVGPAWSLLFLVRGGSGVSNEDRLRLGHVCCLSENSLELAGPSSLCIQMFTRKHVDSYRCPFHLCLCGLWGSRIQAVIVIWKSFPRGTLGWREARWTAWKTQPPSGGHSTINSHTADEVVRQEPMMANELFVTKALWYSTASFATDCL